jgi:hypothetical protein
VIRLVRLVVLISLAAAFGVAHGDTCPDAPPADWRTALTRLEPGLVAMPELAESEDGRRVLRALGGAGDETAALAALARLYDAPIWSGTPSPWAGWTNRAARQVAAYGLFVRDEGSGTIVAAGAYWASPLLPRLHVVRLDRPVDVARPDDRLMARVGGCALRVDEWIEIPAELLLRTIREDAEASVLLAAPSEEAGPPIRLWLRGEDLLEAVTFRHIATFDLDAFSAWFAGEGPGPVALTRALPQLRSSLGPRDLWALLRDVRR